MAQLSTRARAQVLETVVVLAFAFILAAILVLTAMLV